MRFIILITAIALAGCNTTSGSYVRLDGAAVDPTKYEVDYQVCKGEMAKAQMGGAVVSTGNMFEDADNSIQRDEQAGNVILGCMAGKGYRFVVGQS